MSKIKTFIFIGMFIAILAGLITTRVILTGNLVREQQEEENYQEWLVENCKCLEQERITCPEGFEYKDSFCRAGELFTLTLKKCSKYDCNGEIHIFNNQTEKWEK